MLCLDEVGSFESNGNDEALKLDCIGLSCSIRINDNSVCNGRTEERESIFKSDETLKNGQKLEKVKKNQQ